MKLMIRTFVVSLAILSAFLARAEEPARRTIGDAAWLAGRWVGEGLGGSVEENWSPPQGGQMIGHFALLRDGRPIFYEIMLLEEHEGGLRMRVKHFNPDFVGWEEKDGWHAFEPIASGPDSLRFEGLWLRREGEELVATVTIRNRADNSVRDETLRHRRAPL
jgi:hypothetical protein